jgi:hypothetical protein
MGVGTLGHNGSLEFTSRLLMRVRRARCGHIFRLAQTFVAERTRQTMKNSLKSLLVAAAVTGLLGATTAVPAAFADDKAPATDTAKDTTKDKKAKSKKASSKDKKDAKDKNSCKGANGCSGKDEKK